MYYYLFKEPHKERLYLGSGDWNKVFTDEWFVSGLFNWQRLSKLIDHHVLDSISNSGHNSTLMANRITFWSNNSDYNKLRVYSETVMCERVYVEYIDYKLTGSAYADYETVNA